MAAFRAHVIHSAREFLEVLRLAEVAVDARETDIGHAVELAQTVHHHFTNARGFDLAFAGCFNLTLDARNEPVEAFLRDTAFARGKSNRLFDFQAVERFAARLAIRAAFDNGDFAQLDTLESRETRAAPFTLPPSADRGVIFGRARILYLAVVMRAEGAAHLFLDALVKHEARTRR